MRFGQWRDEYQAKLDDFAKQAATSGAAQVTPAAPDAMKGARQATRNAVGALTRLPSARQNGTPNCRTPAARFYRVSDGHPVNVQSSQNCPPAVRMSAHRAAAGQCPEEAVVLMVACD
jgi:hypothetical protein